MGAFEVGWSPLQIGEREELRKLWRVMILVGVFGLAFSAAATGKKRAFDLQIGHTEGVSTVAFSPDGKILASGSRDHTIKLWDSMNGRLLRTLHGHVGDVRSVVFSPDGEDLVSVSWDGAMKFWDVATGKLLRTLKDIPSSSLALSPDGRLFAAGSGNGRVGIWNAASGRRLRSIKAHYQSAASVAFSPDGKSLASGSWDNTIKLWDVATGKLIFTIRGHRQKVHSVAFSYGGLRLVSGSADHSVKVWEVSTGKRRKTLEGHTDAVHSVAFTPEGQWLVSGSADSAVKVWDPTSGQLIRTLAGESSHIDQIALSPNGEILASAGWEGLQVWNLPTGSLAWVQPIRLGNVNGLDDSPDGRHLVTGSDFVSGREERALEVWAQRLTGGRAEAPTDLLSAKTQAVQDEPRTEGFNEPAAKPELALKDIGGVPGDPTPYPSRPPILRWIEPFGTTESDETHVTLAYVGQTPLEEILVLFNGEPIDLAVEGTDRIVIPLAVTSRNNRLIAVAFDSKGLRSDPLRVEFEKTGDAAGAAGIDVTLSGGMPRGIEDTEEIVVNEKALRIAHVDPENQSLRLLGNEGTLREGLNWIENLGQRGRFWYEEQKLQRMPNPYARSYAILVAIDDYERTAEPNRGPTGFEPLEAMVPKAQELKATLMQIGFPGTNIMTLYNGQATSANVREALQQFWKGGRHAGADRLVFYFGGHGRGTDGHGALVTYDYDPRRPAITSFLMSEFVSSHFPHADVHHMLVALDACSSGLAIPGMQTLDGLDKERLKAFRQLTVVLGDTEERARNLLVAGTEDEEALYSRGGVFTQALIEGLRWRADLNQDGVIQFEELALHVRNAVRDTARKAGVRQRPAYYVGSEFGAGRVLFLTPNGRGKGPEPDPAQGSIR